MKRLSKVVQIIMFLTTISAFTDFNNQLTLSQFGKKVNKNKSLQVSSRYALDPVSQVFKTNDFQTIQLKFGQYGTERLPCRIGYFTVSESAFSKGRVPFGSRVELPSYTIAGNKAANIEPNDYLLQVQDPNFVVFSFKQNLLRKKIFTDFTISDTQQACQIEYPEDGGKSGSMISYHIPGSAYHDVEYRDVTPELTFGSGIVTSMFVDNKRVALPTSGSKLTLKSGTKFKIQFQNPSNLPSQSQTWLLYVQSENTSKNLVFEMHFSLTKNEKITNLKLKSKSGRFDGFIRVAAIQSRLPPPLPNALRSQETDQWQLATQIQSMPATPLSMFLLWPYQWTKDVGQQIQWNQERNINLSSCTTSSLLLPLLARSNFELASCWFDQLIDRQNKGKVVFDEATNSFVTLMNMLVANYYDADILKFQKGLANPASSPIMSYSSLEKAMEKLFDRFRSEIPISLELKFNDDGTYSFEVSSMDIVSTQPAGSEKKVLFCLPGYKALTGGYLYKGRSANRDPIKGDIIFAQGDTSSVPGDQQITFVVNGVPSWSGRFLPDDLWNRISGLDQESLQIQLNRLLSQPLPGIKSGVYDQGKVLFQIAMSAKYATYVLLAQNGKLPPYSKSLKVPQSIKDQLNPLLNYIKQVLDAWLITKTYEKKKLSNFFVGDELGKGIVAVTGTKSDTGGLLDDGNAVYTGHNRQYGYFLGSAAIVAELDNLFMNPSWIATKQSNGIVKVLRKQFVDMLWRDYANPSINDADDMPFNRYGNAWEGISSSKGMPPTGAYPSRNNESISEDFNGYYATWLYARAILNSSLSSANTKGFRSFERYSKANMDMIAKAARALFYNNGNWVYKNEAFNFNKTTGIQWDNKVDSATNLILGSPPCRFSEEGCLYSKYRFDVFCEDLVNTYQGDCKCSSGGCGCQ